MVQALMFVSVDIDHLSRHAIEPVPSYSVKREEYKAQQILSAPERSIWTSWRDASCWDEQMCGSPPQPIHLSPLPKDRLSPESGHLPSIHGLETSCGLGRTTMSAVGSQGRALGSLRSLFWLLHHAQIRDNVLLLLELREVSSYPHEETLTRALLVN